MKHAVVEFHGRDKAGMHYYVTACGLRLRLRGPVEDESQPVDMAGDGPGWCPVCHPEQVQQNLEGASLHPEIGALESDGSVIAEDLGDEEVIAEEIVEE